MSMEQVSQIIGRALLDDGFREQLMNAPDQVLGAFDLSAQEVEALKQLNAEQFQQLNEAFQARLGGGEADLTQASDFLKIEGIDGSITIGEGHKDWGFIARFRDGRACRRRFVFAIPPNRCSGGDAVLIDRLPNVFRRPRVSPVDFPSRALSLISAEFVVVDGNIACRICIVQRIVSAPVEPPRSHEQHRGLALRPRRWVAVRRPWPLPRRPGPPITQQLSGPPPHGQAALELEACCKAGT